MYSKNASATSAGRPQTDFQSEFSVSWRHALISIGKYAAHVTPAMTVLIRGNTVLAGHQCGNPGDPQVPAHSCVEHQGVLITTPERSFPHRFRLRLQQPQISLNTAPR